MMKQQDISIETQQLKPATTYRNKVLQQYDPPLLLVVCWQVACDAAGAGWPAIFLSGWDGGGYVGKGRGRKAERGHCM